MAPTPFLSSLDHNLKISQGGFGTVYRDPRDSTRCIKVMKSPITGDEAENLCRLAEVARWTRPSVADHLLTRFAWPIEIFGDPQSVHGFSMPLAPPSASFSLKVAGKSSQPSLQLKFLMDAAYWSSVAVQSSAPYADRQDRFEIAIDCLDSLALLHELGLTYGDVSANNIAGRLDRRPGVFFFDADSITTIDIRATRHLNTPDWETPAGLGPVEIDRSRYALLLLRLMLQAPRAFPEPSVMAALDPADQAAFGSALVDCYQHGSDDAFAALGRALRYSLDPVRQSRSLEEARSSGFARRVLRVSESMADAASVRLRSQAEAQIELELAVDAASGFERRRLLRRASFGGSAFTLDALPRLEFERPPRTVDELHSLIFDAQFEIITGHLTSSGLGGVESDPLLPRAVQHSLLQVPTVPIAVTLAPGEAQLGFTWPSSPLVNSARISVTTDAGTHHIDAKREPGAARASRSVSAPHGAHCTAQLRLAAQSPSGATFFAASGSAATFEVPPVPKPPRPSVLLPGDDGSSFAVFDPVEAERLRLEAERARRKRTIRNSLISTVATVALLAGGWYSYQRWFVEHINLGEPTVMLQSSAHNSISLTWSDAPDTFDAVRVSTSVNGHVWSMLPDGATLVNFDAQRVSFVPSASRDWTFVQLEFLDGDVVANTAVGIRGNRATLGASFPTWVLHNNTLTVTWDTLSLQGPASRFDIKMWTSGTTPSTYTVAFTNSKTFDVSSVPSDSHLIVQIRAVFSDGSATPWVYAPPVRIP